MGFPLQSRHERLRSAADKDLKGDAVVEVLCDLVGAGLEYLAAEAERFDLRSRVGGKTYFAFRLPGTTKLSRPVNAGLFGPETAAAHLRRILLPDAEGIPLPEVTRALYTAAMSYCCTADLLKTDDKKSPGTFFEIMIGHIVARTLGTNPQKQITVPSLDIQITIPTDYVFTFATGKNRLHLPVKASTRERVVQVWAH